MLGNFSFHGSEYSHSIEMWDSILSDLNIKSDCIIHVHPHGNHHNLWKKLGYEIIEDDDCQWSDGVVGGYCCEVYYKGLEIGNLVNPMEHSTDVGFGWERLVMVMEGKNRVDETSLFQTDLPPVIRDHVRTLDCLWDNGIVPGNKGRNYICRKLLRRCLSFYHLKFKWSDWLNNEWVLRNKGLEKGKKMWNRHKNKTLQWWWETCGLTEEDLKLLK